MTTPESGVCGVQIRHSATISRASSAQPRHRPRLGGLVFLLAPLCISKARLPDLRLLGPLLQVRCQRASQLPLCCPTQWEVAWRDGTVHAGSALEGGRGASSHAGPCPALGYRIRSFPSRVAHGLMTEPQIPAPKHTAPKAMPAVSRAAPPAQGNLNTTRTVGSHS